MELYTPFEVNEWDQLFNVDDILDDRVPPSSAVMGEDVKLGKTPFNFDDMSSFDKDVNGKSGIVIQEGVQPVMMSGSLSSKSPWHESDSGVSDTISFAGSPIGNSSMEEMAVDPDLILPTFDQNVDNAGIDGEDLAAYLLGEQGFENDTYPKVCLPGANTSQLKHPNPSVATQSTSDRPVRKCVSKKVNVVDFESSDSEGSVSDEVQNTKSKAGSSSLNYFKDPSTFSSSGSDIKIVRVLKPPACGADASADDIMKALDERSKKNARQAKVNREKKKAYIQGLESDLEILKKENRDLQTENCQMKSEMSSLKEEVHYLKSVLANASALSGLLKNISNVKEVKLSANITGRKRSGSGDDDHSYNMVESRPQKRARLVNENLKKAGVCLHVSDGEACLEFCAHCASLANKTHGRVNAL